tara:strand:+ start:919 stop:1614 length:696 start_codon:yes stop_codon:yes gene_type:complete
VKCREIKDDSFFDINANDRFKYKGNTICCNKCIDDIRKDYVIKYKRGYNNFIVEKADIKKNWSDLRFINNLFLKNKYVKCTSCNISLKKGEVYKGISSMNKPFCSSCLVKINNDNIKSVVSFFTGDNKLYGIHNTIKGSFNRPFAINLGIKKIGHYLNFYLKCSDLTFKAHIENQFTEGMDWCNHGLKGWHFDHHEPISRAKTYEDMIRLSHYTNFKPLWAKDNIAKSNKF